MSDFEWKSIKNEPPKYYGSYLCIICTDDDPVIKVLEFQKDTWYLEDEPLYSFCYYMRPVLWTDLPDISKMKDEINNELSDEEEEDGRETD